MKDLKPQERHGSRSHETVPGARVKPLRSPLFALVERSTALGRFGIREVDICEKFPGFASIGREMLSNRVFDW